MVAAAIEAIKLKAPVVAPSSSGGSAWKERAKMELYE